MSETREANASRVRVGDHRSRDCRHEQALFKAELGGVGVLEDAPDHVLRIYDLNWMTCQTLRLGWAVMSHLLMNV